MRRLRQLEEGKAKTSNEWSRIKLGEATGPLRRAGKPFGLKAGVELRICKTPGVGANPIQD